MGESTKENRRRGTVAIIGWVAIICLVAAVSEFASYAFLKIYASSRIPWLMYERPAMPTRDDYDDYLARRHPVLGWPPIEDEEPEIPQPRDVPSSAEFTEECITAYGDSFVFGEEVDASEAWSNFLTERLGCRVGNYGVSGYGTGQAFLRFQINKRDTAPITYLGIHPVNFKRSVTQTHLFLQHDYRYFKPRYFLNDGKLELAVLPTISYDDLDTFFRSPEKFLQHETLLPGSTLGPIPIKFPYSARVFDIGMTEEVRNWVAGRPAWSGYIKRGHQSRALDLYIHIAAEFAGQCRIREKTCFIVFFPGKKEYEHFSQTGTRAIQPLLDAFDSHEFPYLDLTRSFYSELSGAPLCSVLADSVGCFGHFNAEGNQIVSDSLHEYLRTNGYL